ncbi:ABC transporter substrate-binding protein [Gordonia alkanivorans]|uniref:ABC transporter substrate-binding protein n=1 Tax=Gordonia alkanivorans TaxID=84096 RepID=UPI00244811B2|nr:ABC transporter substrate-binding protein [Gordonia alkanivorans]MDH3018075.1 ABC transporter substrate-binding protein [Gordonia alkanivorans]MDH3043488.1 ABC transporter substrate-binding protein [Gordonia alkanivorans]MDH3061191.1 ABC transporter substrate-binding protein [Gordonia alkanivorans]
MFRSVRSRRTRTLLAVGLSAAALLSACGERPATGDGTSTGVPAAAGEYLDGGVIEYGHEQEPPCIHGGWVQNAYLARQYLDNLVSLDDNGSPVPWLATSWEISPDRKTYTFRLKPDVRFSDGTDLDAAAVKTNFDKYLDPDAPNGTVMAYIGQYYAGGEVRDRNTYVLHLKQPYSPLLTVLTQGYFGIQSPTALARGKKENCSKPVGSGPFIIERWDRNRSITFVRNANYNSAPANAKHQGPAYVDKVIWKFLKDPVLRYGSLTSGSSDVIYNVPAINWADATTRFQTRQYVTPGRPNAITLNVDHAPFDDVRVRQAFAYSADREKAVETAFLGVVPFNSNGALSQSTPDYDPAAGAYVRDPEKANALLDQAGWTARDSDGIRTKDGRRLTARVVYAADAIVGPEGAAILQNIAHQARDVGFDIELVPATQSEYFGGNYAKAPTYDAYVGYWTSPTPGLLYINWRQRLEDSPNPHNTAYYNDPTLQGFIEKANSAADPAEQREFYRRAQKLIGDEAMSIGLYTQTTSIAVNPKLHDVWVEKSQGEPVFADARFVR